MRKSTKLVVITAALMLFCAMTSFAVTKGWAQLDGQWVYYEDSDGNLATDVWKVSGGKNYYLDSDGYMATSQLVDDDNYYVGADGARVLNDWVLIPVEDDEWGQDARWYHFGSNGKADKDITKKINGKTYRFDADGKMLYGFVDASGDMTDDILKAEYYYGTAEDGAQYKGWYEYVEGLEGYDSTTQWFYFSAKIVKDEKKLIKKVYYNFDENGVMADTWSLNTVSDAATTSFYDGNGALKKNCWVYAVPTAEQNASDHTNEQSRWFYVNGNGIPVVNQVKYIKKKFYLFDEVGRMKTGLVAVSDSDGNELDRLASKATKILKTGLTDLTADELKALSYTSIYYFSNDEVNDGAAKTGTITLDLADGEKKFVFDTATYKALHGVKKSVLYDHGMLQAAGSYNAVKTVGTIKYIVNTSGKVQTKAGTYRTGDDDYLVVMKAGSEAGGVVIDYKVPDGTYWDAEGKKTYSASKVASFLKQGTADKYNPAWETEFKY